MTEAKNLNRSNAAELAGGLRDSVGSWLDDMSAGLEPAHFRFCDRFSLVPSSGHRGQFVTCFAVKAAWHAGIWPTWPVPRREAIVEFLTSFQRPDGTFVDEAMLRRFRLGGAIDRLRHPRFSPAGRERYIAAETRQMAAALLQIGAMPRYRLPEPHTDEASLRSFIRSLDWNVPWGAGSHTSHAIFFLHVNAMLAGERDNPLIEVAFDELDRLRDARSGTWFVGEVDERMRVNGAMKVLTAYRWTGRPLPYARELLDTALDARFAESGCSFLNRLFVVENASRHCPGYRSEDIEKLALVSLERSLAFRQADGAFSFYPHRAQRRYLDAYVSLGGRQSDIHGTVMLTWAVALCLELLGLTDQGWCPSTP